MKITSKFRTSIGLMLVVVLSFAPVYANNSQSNGNNASVATTSEKLGLNDYSYFEYSPKADAAYVIFGDTVSGHNASYIEGTNAAMFNPEDEYYSEKTGELGVRGRKFYKPNNVNIKIDDGFCSEEDKEFYISIAYYDYGPSPGKFFFDYISDEGDVTTVTIEKSGAVQDWFVKGIYIDNADLKKAFDSGANVRLRQNAYNLFKRVEIVNISKLKREARATNAVCLGMDIKPTLLQMGIIDGKVPEYSDGNLHINCTNNDVDNLFSAISGKKRTSNDNTLTNGELIKKCFDFAGVKYSGENLLEEAYKTGIVKEDSLIFELESYATLYNMYSVVYNTLFYEREDRISLASDMIQRNCFSDELVYSISDANYIKTWYSTPRKCPYTVIRDNATGTEYKYMNIFGKATWRPYVTFQNMTNDGKSFVCSLANGEMFLYNTETQMLEYIDKCLNSGARLHAIVGTDNNVYYFTRNTIDSIWKYDTKTKEKIKLADAPAGILISDLSISNDCNFIGADCIDSNGKFITSEQYLFTLYDIKNDNWTWVIHSFDYSNDLTHPQVNPEYTNLISFAHEIATGYTANDIYDRIWIYDTDTKTADVVFKQGVRPENNKAMQGATHEVWSNNGEYIYFVSYSVSDSEANMSNIGKAPSVIRFNKDGSHRKYYYNPKDPTRYYSHCYPSGDDKYIIVDTSMNENTLTLINTQTNEIFDLAEVVWQNKSQHPYQMHPIMARDSYVANWGGLYEGVLGVFWMDFTDVANKSAKGGRVEINDTVSSVSYKNLDCEISKTTKEGKDCYYTKPNNKMYIDINESIVDCIDGKIKLTFEYYDNSIQPLVITYTSGVKTDNDYVNVENAEKRIVRKATRKWKKAEVIIESGNFEDIGTYDSDLNIKGLCSAAYIRNIVAEKID